MLNQLKTHVLAPYSGTHFTENPLSSLSLAALLAVAVAISPVGVSPAHAGGHHSTEGGAAEQPNSPLDHAPIGVMADHVHPKGEFMLSYRDMKMVMDGNRDGTNHVGSQGVFDRGFMVAPTRMRMDMHMFGLMYGITDRVTAMVMLPYIDMSMDHVARSGARFTTRSSGVGDTSVNALVSALSTHDSDLVLRLGLSLPTGSISRRDNTPMGEQRLPYPMQLGSGTYDLLPGLTFKKREGLQLSWGTQLAGVIRPGSNSKGYTLGNRVSASTWAAWQWADWVSTSLRLRGEGWEDIDGADKALNPAVVPTARPDLRGGKRIDLILGANLLGTGSDSVIGDILKGHRIAFEIAAPVYQDLDGPQLETDWVFTLGWQRVL
jgi:hypothetical protein